MSTTEPISMSAALGRRVIAQDTADEVGEVKAFVIDRSGRSIDRVQVAGRARHARLIDWSDIATFGPDAVMITAHDAVHEPADDRDADVVRGNVDVLGARILDTSGFEHGTVADLEFDPGSGDIVAVVAADGHIDRQRIRALGTYALVVDPD